jgi:NADP-dependent aldehyde dehydrogenase
MNLHGGNLLGRTRSARAPASQRAGDPRGGVLEPAFHPATPDEVDGAATLATAAFPRYRALTPDARADLLDAIAATLEGRADAIVERADLETALGAPRLRGELGRTTGQLRMFAELLREGSWVDARIDPALPERTPLPRPDLRRMLIALGPVAVFGASNFPLAFSVAGGDTASALAAGCPVVVKAHPAHPGTSELVAGAILDAAAAQGMPDGVFSLLHGASPDVGLALVRHPEIAAVGFTGSLRAGRALFDAAAARPVPIPVYAEMGSINPLFILPKALERRGEAIAAGFHASLTLGGGQFCTNPGLVVAPAGEGVERFAQGVAERIAATPPAAMLTAAIGASYLEGIDRHAEVGGVGTVARVETADGGGQGAAALLTTSAATFLDAPRLAEELFGPAALLVTGDSQEELLRVASGLEGQLTATIHGEPEEFEEYRELVAVLETRVGRLIYNGFPTGVEVGSAMHHGGPYPASTDVRSTSVGTAAIQRFARPICYQDAPQTLLPPELRDDNPRGVWRLIDGRLGQQPLDVA